MIALVTGASSGIGEATARRLAREDGDGEPARLVLVARREERLRALAEELGGATVVAADLTEPDAPARIAAAVEAEHGRLDLLVNNAGRGLARQLRRRRLRERAPHDGAQLRRRRAPHRGAAAAAAPLGAERDRQRLEHRRAGSRAAGAAPTARASSRSPAGPTRCTSRRRPTACTSGSSCPASSPPRASRRPRWSTGRLTRWIVSSAERVADAIVDVAVNRKLERYVPRPYALAAALRTTAPGLVRRASLAASPRTRAADPPAPWPRRAAA